MKNYISESEKAVHEAFILKEKGHSLPMITAIFPKFKDDIETAFYMAALMRDNAEFLSPNPESLQKALMDLGKKPVAVKEKVRRMAGDMSMRTSTPGFIESFFKRTWVWKATIPALVFVMAIIGIATYETGGSTKPVTKPEDIIAAYEQFATGSERGMVDDSDSSMNNFYSSVTSSMTPDTTSGN